LATDTKHLLKRGPTWYVVVEIPKHLRPRLGGQSRFKRSLKTDSLKAANDRKHAFVAEFKLQIAALNGEAGAPDLTILRDAMEARKRLTALQRVHEPIGPEEWTQHEHELSDLLERAKDLQRDGNPEGARLFADVVTGRATPMRALTTEWLSSRGGSVRASVHAQQTAIINRFLEWAGASIAIEQVDRLLAGEYLTFLRSSASGILPSTARRYFSALSTFWEWLISRGNAHHNPWSRHKHPKTRSDRACFTEEALVTLLSGTPHVKSVRYGSIMHDMVRLGLVTGARLNELCGLRNQDVEMRDDGWWLKFREYEGHTLKRKASRRDTPLHNSVAHVIERRRREDSKFLFPDLTSGGPDNRRSWNVSRAFSAYRKHVGVSGRGEVFHALRNTFVEYTEGIGVPLTTIQLLIGQSRAGIMGATNTYTQGTRVDLREAINKLSFGPEVMPLLSNKEPA
jgi:integrase